MHHNKIYIVISIIVIIRGKQGYLCPGFSHLFFRGIFISFFFKNMANKQKITKTEARVLIFLNNSDKLTRFKMYMSTKLNIEYGYLHKTIRSLMQKGWISEHKTLYSIKKFYELTNLGKTKIEDAVLLLSG